jgi:hypothetical protein
MNRNSAKTIKSNAMNFVNKNNGFLGGRGGINGPKYYKGPILYLGI